MQLRVDKLNKEAEEQLKAKQEEAVKKVQQAKEALEANGAEFVSQEEFAKLKREQPNRKVGA